MTSQDCTSVSSAPSIYTDANGSPAASYWNFSRFTFKIDPNSMLGKIRDAVCKAWADFCTWAWNLVAPASNDTCKCTKAQERGISSSNKPNYYTPRSGPVRDCKKNNSDGLADIFQGDDGSEGNLSGHSTPVKQSQGSFFRSYDIVTNFQAGDQQTRSALPRPYGQEYSSGGSRYMQDNGGSVIITASIANRDIISSVGGKNTFDFSTRESLIYTDNNEPDLLPSESPTGDIDDDLGDFLSGDSGNTLKINISDSSATEILASQLPGSPKLKAPSEMDRGIDNSTGGSRTEENLDAATAAANGMNSPNKTKSALPALFLAVTDGQAIADGTNNPSSVTAGEETSAVTNVSMKATEEADTKISE